MKGKELAECKECQGEGVFGVVKVKEKWMYNAGCENRDVKPIYCKASSGLFESKEQAAEEWNRKQEDYEQTV